MSVGRDGGRHSTLADRTAIVLVLAAFIFSLIRRLTMELALGPPGRREVGLTGPTTQAASSAANRPGATAAEELAVDRRFERSLIPRELAVVAMIALVIVAREILS